MNASSLGLVKDTKPRDWHNCKRNITKQCFPWLRKNYNVLLIQGDYIPLFVDDFTIFIDDIVKENAPLLVARKEIRDFLETHPISRGSWLITTRRLLVSHYP
jgi:hypothetical protein